MGSGVRTLQCSEPTQTSPSRKRGASRSQVRVARPDAVASSPVAPTRTESIAADRVAPVRHRIRGEGRHDGHRRLTPLGALPDSRRIWSCRRSRAVVRGEPDRPSDHAEPDVVFAMSDGHDRRRGDPRPGRGPGAGTSADRSRPARRHRAGADRGKLNLEELRRDPGVARRTAISGARSPSSIRRCATFAISRSTCAPSILDDLGLVAAVRWYVSPSRSPRRIPDEVRRDVIPPGLGDELESACFRVLQEALTNVATSRAGKATSASSSGESTASSSSSSRMTGSGSTSFGVRRRAGRRPTLGLTGMSERICTIGGSIEITSAPGRGTTHQRPIPAGGRDRAGTPAR